MGKEAQSFDVNATYAPSLNMHRSPLGGRNFEYYSEDPLLVGKIGALQAVESGNDMLLAFPIDAGENTFEKQLKSYLKEDRAGTLIALQNAAHNILYYVMQTGEVK